MDSTELTNVAVYMRVSGEHQKSAGTIEDQHRALDR
jgi:DNA invertase Pin-like site-specific DNA recombinase